MPTPPRSGPAPSTGGGAFITSADSIPEPTRRRAPAKSTPDRHKAAQARRATRQGPPEGFPPLADEPSSPAAPTPEQPVRATPTILTGGGDAWSDGGGFALGLLAYILGLNYLRHGKAGVKAWFMAKLFNKPTNFTADPTPPTPTQHGAVA